jgi:bile acid:Na+ symporter, BASS family
MEPIKTIGLAFNLSMAATVFAYGLRARYDDLHYLLRRPRLLVVSLIAMFVVVPTVALMLAMTLDLPLGAKVAMVALAISPTSPLLPKQERESGGDGSYAIGLSVVVVLLSQVITPGLVVFLSRLMSKPFALDPLAVVKLMMVVALLPLVAGMVLRRFVGTDVERASEPLMKLANLVMLVALVAILVIVLPKVWSFVSIVVVLTFVLYNLMAFAIGDVLGGPQPNHSIVLAFSCANRHPAIPLAIAAANYPGQNFAVAIILCLIVNGIIAKVYLRWRRKYTEIVK